MLVSLWEVQCALLLALLAETGAQGPLLASKCCPVGQELKMTSGVHSCVDVPLNNEPLVETETVAEARRKLPDGTKLPSWMDTWTPFYIPEVDKHITNSSFHFLENAPQNAVLRFGQRPCPEEDIQYLNSRREYRILPNGTLRLNVMKLTSARSDQSNKTQVYLPPDTWCSDSYKNTENMLRFIVLACPCKKALCVPKCCYSSEHLHTKNEWNSIKAPCNSGSSKFVPAIYKDKCLVAGPHFQSGVDPHSVNTSGCGYYERFEKVPSVSPTVDKQCDNTSQSIIYTVLQNHLPFCEKGYTSITLNHGTARMVNPLRSWLQQDGSAVMQNFGKEHFPRGTFCLDQSTMEGQDNSLMVDNAVFCRVTETQTKLSISDYYYNFLFLAGGVFLLLTVVTHALVPVLRRSDHSKALCCHCIALLVASVTMVSGRVGKLLEENSCIASAFIVQFSFLAAFFWLNVMCFDFAKSFTRMRQTISRYRRSSRLFILYSLYAWGSAAVITGITIVIQFLPVETVCHNNPLRPNIGIKTCWFLDKKATFIYYFLPISLVLLANVVMFGVTVLRIYIVKLGTSILRKKDNSTSKKDKKEVDSQMSSVIVRLFLLMGVTWVTEIISWALATGDCFFMLMDAINLLRGVAIFVITCCQKRVAKEFVERLRAVGSFFGCVESATGVLRPSGSSYAAEHTSSSVVSLSESVVTASTLEAEVVNDTEAH